MHACDWSTRLLPSKERCDAGEYPCAKRTYEMHCADLNQGVTLQNASVDAFFKWYNFCGMAAVK
jgi:hypothetical protein